PTPLRKRIADVTDMLAREQIDTAELLEGGYRKETGRRGAPRPADVAGDVRSRTAPKAVSELVELITELTGQMEAAAGELQFELAGRLRDEIVELKKELRQMQAANA
ncbi:MAG: UvrB/UvrC motif-containing protein, partial [Actinomycetaceae bacterium]